MRKPVKKTGKKMRKTDFEERFALMVEEYQKAKEFLDAMSEGSEEYIKQKKMCYILFAKAEKFVNKQ